LSRRASLDFAVLEFGAEGGVPALPFRSGRGELRLMSDSSHRFGSLLGLAQMGHHLFNGGTHLDNCIGNFLFRRAERPRPITKFEWVPDVDASPMDKLRVKIVFAHLLPASQPFLHFLWHFSARYAGMEPHTTVK
jgi:hypothetical protein